MFDGQSRSWSLGSYRPFVNVMALIFLAVTSVTFLLPPALPVTAENMNYASVVFVIVAAACAMTWLVDGRSNFEGPLDLEDRLMAAKKA